ncbi:MAG: hypothetical protein WCE45_01270 [Sedimentisphaerales bacterium]
MGVAGGIIGGIIGVHEGSDSIILKLGLDNAALFIFIVAVVSLMQWLALRRVLRRAGFWVLASIIGFTISSVSHGVVCHICGYPDDLGLPLGALVWAAACVVGGALAGLLQQRILQRQVRHLAWWVPASAAGWGLSVIGLGLIGHVIHFPKEAGPFASLIGNLVLPAVLGAILLGVITGGALIWLLRQPMPAEELENANHTKF